MLWFVMTMTSAGYQKFLLAAKIFKWKENIPGVVRYQQQKKKRSRHKRTRMEVWHDGDAADIGLDSWLM